MCAARLTSHPTVRIRLLVARTVRIARCLASHDLFFARCCASHSPHRPSSRSHPLHPCALLTSSDVQPLVPASFVCASPFQCCARSSPCHVPSRSLPPPLCAQQRCSPCLTSAFSVRAPGAATMCISHLIVRPATHVCLLCVCLITRLTLRPTALITKNVNGTNRKRMSWILERM
jgi:hypothetical protein